MKITCPQTEALTPLMGLTRDGMSTTTNPMWPQVRAGYLRIISIQLSFLISRNCEFKLIVFSAGGGPDGYDFFKGTEIDIEANNTYSTVKKFLN